MSDKILRGNRIRSRYKALDNRGFTMMEIIIVVAILSIIMGLAAIGMNGYFEMSEQIQRQEVAETAFYSLQSQINYLKRNDKLEEFEQQLKDYNVSVYGNERVLTADQNRTIVTVNYDGENADAFYNDEYYPAHTGSEIIYVTLDKALDNQSANPIYDILSKALQDEEVMEDSFLMEYDLATGVVRGVFYSQSAEALNYTFTDLDGAKKNKTDCIMRDAKQLSDKKQGYYGVLFTSQEYEEVVKTLNTPEAVTLVNGDRLYLTWQEANADNPSFMDGTYRLEALSYIITLYNQRNEVIAVYDMPRINMYQDITGTESGILDYLDDFAGTVEDTVEGSTKTARIGYSDMSYEEAPDGIAGEYYYMLLECLDHPFHENGYDFDGADTIYATLEVICGEDGNMRSETSPMSNVESVYYQYVEDAEGNEEYGIACARHLWNIRNGHYNGDYRLNADIDWGSIEGRGRDISYTAAAFADKSVSGLVRGFEGTLTGEKTGEAAEGTEYDFYQIHGIRQSEPDRQQVGFFAVNLGTVSNLMLTDYQVRGAYDVGTLAGINKGTMENVYVLDASVEAQYRAGGLTGTNDGSISDVTVTTGSNRITANHTLGGVAGLHNGSMEDCIAVCNVEAYLTDDNTSVFGTGQGRYVGGLVGAARAGASAARLYNGAILDENGIPRKPENSGAGVEKPEGIAISTVTGIGYMGGVIGVIESDAGTYEQLYNYARIQILYMSPQEKTDRGDNDLKDYMYQYYGGITGWQGTGNVLDACVNYTAASVRFVRDGEELDADTLASYVSRGNGTYVNEKNNPKYIGGIAGRNDGRVQDCISAYREYGTFTEELDKINGIIDKTLGYYVGYYVGGLVGYNSGQVLFTPAMKTDTLQVVAEAYITSGGIVAYQTATGSVANESGKRIYVKGVVSAILDYAGGVAGTLGAGDISGAYTNDCIISGQYAGGISSDLGAGKTLEECHNTGTVFGRGVGTSAGGWVGGIVGRNAGILRECTNMGTVSTYLTEEAFSRSSSNHGDIGGIVGQNIGTVENCHFKRNAEGTNCLAANFYCNIGGIIGRNLYNGTSQTGVLVNDTGEEIVDVPIFVGRGTGNTYYANVGGVLGCATGPVNIRDYTYISTISMYSTANWSNGSNGVGGIAGLLRAEQTMSGCTMRGSIVSVNVRNGGLVGYMAGGVIEADNKVTAQASIQGSSFTGGVVGRYHTTDSNARMLVKNNSATVIGSGSYTGGIAGYVGAGSYLDLSGCVNSGTVSGTKCVGGLVGGLESNVVTSFSGVENYGTVTGTDSVGGMIGILRTAVSAQDTFSFSYSYNRGPVYLGQASGNYHGGFIGESCTRLHMERCLNTNTVLPLDASYRTNYVGGIVGIARQSTEFRYCENGSEVCGYQDVGGLLGRTDNGGSYLAFACIGQEHAKVRATSGNAGGLFGYIYAPGESEVQILECQNRGSVDAPVRVGGMAGFIECPFTISHSHNTGVIGEYAEGRFSTSEAGGILGRASYYRGVVGRQSLIEDCTQNADIKNVTSYAGGIAGFIRQNVKIDYCRTGDRADCNLYTVSSANYIGGVVGGFDSSRTMYITGSMNRAGIKASGQLAYAGGFVGYIAQNNSCYIGEEGNPAVGCQNYGSIDGTEIISNAGGFIGYSGGTEEISIFSCDNYGAIGENAKETRSCGGLVGRTDATTTAGKESNVVLRNCSQYANFYRAGISVGGLVGYSARNNLTIENCKNGDALKESTGNIYVVSTSGAEHNIGGLVGYCGENRAADNTVRVTQSYNYGNIYVQAQSANITNIGGLIGTACNGVLLGEAGNPSKACRNYGDINGMDTVTLNNVAGIVGRMKAYCSVEIYDAVNEGTIGENVACVYQGAGIAGFSEASGSIEKCVNLGQIYRLGFPNGSGGSGGIIGLAAPRTKLLLADCVNGRPEDENAGRLTGNATTGSTAVVGGILGGTGTGEVEVRSCINYAPMEISNALHYAGGICGRQYSSGTLIMESCVNEGALTFSGTVASYVGGLLGYADSGKNSLIIGGIKEDGTTDETLACTNQGRLLFVDGCQGKVIGSYIGVGNNASLYGIVNTISLAPGKNATITCVGGIAGQIKGTSLVQDCVQRAEISDVIYDGTPIAATAGGIVARLDGTTTLVRCSNGIREDGMQGSGTGESGAVGRITARFDTKTNKEANGVGGIIGVSLAGMSLTDCSNYGDIVLEGKTQGVGGIVGRSYQTDTYLSCVNYGDITSDSRLYHAGGIIGSAVGDSITYKGVITLGDEADVSKRCVNYGNIRVGGGEVSQYIGGIVGSALRISRLYACVNEGEIEGNGAGGTVANAGGIIGRLSASSSAQDSVLADCVQSGNIRDIYYYGWIAASGGTPGGYQVSGIGGIVGAAWSRVDFIRCTSGSDNPEDKKVLECLDHAEAVGGIVGLAGNATMISCRNYMDITGEGRVWYVGGICGYGSAVMGDNGDASLACINYGNIGAEGTESYVGGLLGYGGSVKIYYGQNLGDVGFGSTKATYVGGVAGYVYSSDAAIVEAVNEGKILTRLTASGNAYVSGIGGIAGQFRQPNHSPSVVAGQDISKVLLDKCVNRGSIGTEGISVKGGSVGGIAGSANGTVRDCTNLGQIYAGKEAVGGVLGSVYGEAARCIVTGCVNGAEGDARAGLISPTGEVAYVGGVAGFCQTHNYALHLQIENCTNYGSISLEEGQKNVYVGGIWGYRYMTSAHSQRGSELEIMGCDNYGAIRNGYGYVGGIAGNGVGAVVAYCTNYGDVHAQPLIQDSSNRPYGYIGGIAGRVGNSLVHCINAGNINGNSSVGGLAGSIGAASFPYMMDCYQLGNVSGNSSGSIAGRVSDSYLIDCYVMEGISSPLMGVVTSGSRIVQIQQAEDASVPEGCLNQTVYDKLCDRLGLERRTLTDNRVEDMKYLTRAYHYEPSVPHGEGFGYTPDGTQGNGGTISWNITDTDYPIADSMRIALYPMDMTDEEILADAGGAGAYLTLDAVFAGNVIPAQTEVRIEEKDLPMEETSYRIVLQTIGYRYISLGDDSIQEITADSARSLIVGETLTLPARFVDPEQLLLLDESISGGDVSSGDVSSGDYAQLYGPGFVSGGDAYLKIENAKKQSQETTFWDSFITDEKNTVSGGNGRILVK